MKTVKLYYSTRHENFGDALSPLLLEKVFGCRTQAADYHQAELYAIGSLLQKIAVSRTRAFWSHCSGNYRRELTVWSTGFISDPTPGLTAARRLNICAVRGKRTLAALRRMTGFDKDPALGDGGLLMNLLLEQRPEARYATGIVPHYRDFSHPDVAAMMAKIPNAVKINVLGNPLETLRLLASCEFILSSSLHGLVAAAALGIPSCRLRISEQITGNDFKFDDYYSAFHLDSHPVVTPGELLSGAVRWTELAGGDPVKPEAVDRLRQGLLAAWPF